MPEATLRIADERAALAALFSEESQRWLQDLLGHFEEPRRQLLAARAKAADAACGPLHRDESPLLSPRSHPGDWRTRETPADLRDRRAELHSGTDMADMTAALCSNATAVTLDLEEALPVPGSALQALLNWRQILADPPSTASGEPMPVVFGPRALPRTEAGLAWQGNAASAALVDAGLYLMLLAPLLTGRGQTVCLRLSALHSAEEAAFWRDIIGYAEDNDIVPPDSVKVCVAIETVPAVFACDDIVQALRDRLVALTFDRHACLQSFIRTFPDYPQFVLPDRAELSTATHFLHSWSLVVIGTAHRRGASAIGPCASYLPPPDDSESRVLERLRLDKERHAHDGFDGSSVADPALCKIVRDVYDRLMPGQHQQHRKREDIRITGADLLQVKKGKITEGGVRLNLQVALHGLLAMDAGETGLSLGLRRETASSVGLAADQLWQWRQHATGVLDDGRIIDNGLMRQLLAEEQEKLNAAPEAISRAVERLDRHVAAASLPANLLHTLADS